eukprot:Nk52_evm10s2085 gene=Nk52_evmTU10s2085
MTPRPSPLPGTENEEPQQEEAEKLPTDPYNLEVLSLIKDAQQRHGLRHGDYQRYRQYCGRRLRRIRKALKFLHGRRGFTQRVVEWEVITEDKYLLIPLVKAERCWAYAMDLKQMIEESPRKAFAFKKKLKKAVGYARELEALCREEGKCDARTVLETQAYSKWMQGTLQFEMQEWEAALANLGSAKTIYEKLASACTFEQKALFDSRLSEIEPTLRYCAYNLGQGTTDINELIKMQMNAADSSTIDVLTSQLEKVLQSQSDGDASTAIKGGLNEITFRNKKIPIKNEKLQIQFLRAQQLSVEIEQSKDQDDEAKFSKYDKLLMAYGDAKQIVRDDIRANAANASKFTSQKSEAYAASLEFLEGYLAYLSLTKTIDRNKEMVESAKQKAASSGANNALDVARLYEILYQNVCELMTLSIVNEDEELNKELIADSIACKAWRAFYLGEARLALSKLAKNENGDGEDGIAEALCLYDRATEHCNSAIAHYHLCDSPSKSRTDKVNDINVLMNQIRGQKCTAHATCFLEGEMKRADGDAQNLEGKALYDRLDSYHVGSSLFSKNPNLVSFPPEFESLACKPLFFDVAFDHIEFPALEAKTEEKKGISGFVKNLWGWSS